MINAVTQASREVKNSKKFGKILEVRNVLYRVDGILVQCTCALVLIELYIYM